MAFTAVVRVLVVTLAVAVAQFVDAEVGDFEHEPIVDHAVGTFQAAMRLDVGTVQVPHSLDTHLITVPKKR